ncbi:FAD-dependent oxidoreductase [Gemmobacter aquarius]|uniref:FAD-dependent oxidoreductase n=1 Tax=Paragemmobacter aquarius TaxID=2169400 RepID=A0A2S0UJ37_9RHOB|nr:FAD-binding oxidoreductase [Gemmobacter aquarius]AWB47740.1 FAD-dependent oxidoreductase [Gemmobacter aquarius]
MNLLYANDRAGEYPASYYAATRVDFAAHTPLQGDVRADVCIVGAGYTGLSAALHLAQRGYSVVVLEANRVGFGASGRNGGQVGSGQRNDQDDLERVAGRENARRLWDLAEDAKGLVKSLIADHDIPAPFRHGIAHACWNDRQVSHAHAYADRLQRDYGYDKIEPLDRDAMARLIPSGVFKGGVVDRGAGHIHPLNYAIGLARAALAAGAIIHEKSEVIRLDHGARPVVHTATGKVTCDHVILAANGYLGGLDPQVAARVMPINNFILATEPLGARAGHVLAEPVAVADTRFVVNYWRLSDDNRLLFGGGESYGWRFPDIVKTVRPALLDIYPALRDIRFDYAWGGTLAITMTRNPCFLRVAPNVLSASGYSGHGVALATLAGRILSEAVAGQAERFDLMASLPTPRFPGGASLRWPMLVLAMTWYSMRDRLGL